MTFVFGRNGDISRSPTAQVSIRRMRRSRVGNGTRWTMLVAAINSSAGSFGPIVGRLCAVLKQKAEKMSAVLLRTHSIRQSLVVVVAQNPVSQMMRKLARRPSPLSWPARIGSRRTS